MTIQPYTKKRKTSSRALKLFLWLTAAISFVLIGYGPINTVVQTRMSIRQPTGPMDSKLFSAILMQRTADEDGQIPPLNHERIESQIEFLQANGFQPIRTSDILQLQRNRQLLPRNALVFAVDGNDKELFEAVDAITRRHRWGGLILISPRQLDIDSDSLSWREIQNLQRSQRWEIGLKADATASMALEQPQDASATLASRALDDQAEREARQAVIAQAERDYEALRSLSRERLHSVPDVYAYSSDTDNRLFFHIPTHNRLRTQTVASSFPLAFVISPFVRNSMFTPAHKLNVFAVNPEWSGRQLIDTLQLASTSVETLRTVPESAMNSGWTIDWGTAQPTAQGLKLQPSDIAQGAKVSLSGTDQLRDFQASFQLVMSRSNLRFHLTSAEQDNHGLMIEFQKSEGRVRVYDQPASTTAEGIMLAQANATLLDATTHRIDIFKRGNALAIHVDGESVFPHAIRLPVPITYAQLGVSMQRPQADTEQEASLTIRQAAFTPPRSVLVSWDHEEEYHDYVISYVHRHGTMLTNISPPLALPGSRSVDDKEQRVFRKLANVYRLHLTPKVSISSEDALNQWSPDTLMRALNEQKGDGIYVDFTENESLSVSELDNWLQQASRVLSGSGKSLLVRLPRMLERLAAINSILAVLPNVDIVTERETPEGAAGLEGRMVREESLPTPSPEEIQQMPTIRTISESAPSDPSSVRERARDLEERAEQSFSGAAYERAIAHYTEWHDLSPTDPRPLKRIGDALVNLGYHDEAVGFYRQSLDLQPDNMELAITLAELLTEVDRRASARTLLNIYARLFPENTDILLAQAEWLIRENRNAEALERVEQVRELDPDNFGAHLITLRLADHDDTKLAATQALIERSQSTNEKKRLIRAIEDHDLLTMQHAYMMVAFLQQDVDAEEDTTLQEMIANLEPRTSLVREDFSADGISENWMLDGLTGSLSDGIFRLRAHPTRSGASVRLRRSERWRDSFIEAKINSAEGGFWIYARQSREQLVRLGFEPSQNRLHLQIWGGPQFEVLQSEGVPLRFGDDGLTLRLEVRGNGAIAYVNDRPMLEAPLELPEEFGFGWTAFTIDSPARGDAAVELQHLASGPLPFRTAAVPDAPPDEDDDLLDSIHKALPTISDVSPEWFSVDEDGRWHSQVHPESDFYRIFARYYRLRLTPIVRVSRGADIDPQDLILLTRTHGFAGFILLFDRMPDDPWFEKMNQQLNIPGLDLIAVSTADETVRGIAGSSTLFSRADDANPINLVRYRDLDDTSVAAELEEREPALLFLQ